MDEHIEYRLLNIRLGQKLPGQTFLHLYVFNVVLKSRTVSVTDTEANIFCSSMCFHIRMGNM
jgi:hypothetical protein